MIERIHYQIGILDAARRGASEPLRRRILEAATARGLDAAESFRFFDDEQADAMRNDSPCLTVYFGGAGYRTDLDSLVLAQVAARNVVIPVVTSLERFNEQVPFALQPINGMALPSNDALDALVSLIFENFRLLRGKRRVFLSYRRAEAQNAATGLYHELDAHSFDPFLDTHSIREGDPFQERLWHRMADCDLVVLLYTAGVLTSGWVKKELDRANAMGITVLQVIWPGVKRDRSTDLFEPFYLESGDMEGDSSASGGPELSPDSLGRLILAIERLRARALAAREARLLKLVCGLASERQIPYAISRVGSVDFCLGTEHLTRVCLGVGVPDGTTYYEAVEPPSESKPVRTWLIYDPLCIAPFHQKYLDWLNPTLPVGTLTPLGVEDFLQTLRCV